MFQQADMPELTNDGNINLNNLTNQSLINIQLQMKQQRDQQPAQYQQQVPHPPRKPEHPQEQYSVNQIFWIRKQSSNLANQQIYKRLTKSFHKIKKIRTDPNSAALIAKEYDYESNPIRLVFKRAHDLYNQSTKTNQIVKRKIDKMRGKVDRIKAEIENSQLSLISQVDINKIFSRGATNTLNSQASTGTNNQQQQNASTNVNVIKKGRNHKKAKNLPV